MLLRDLLPGELRANSVSIFGTFGSTVIRPSQRNFLPSGRLGLMQRLFFVAFYLPMLLVCCLFFNVLVHAAMENRLRSPIFVSPVRFAYFVGKVVALGNQTMSRVARGLLLFRLSLLSMPGQERSVRYIVPKFDTQEKLTKYVQESYRTIRELDEMYIAVGNSEPCYRCSAKIVRFDEHQPWFYIACPECSSAVVPYGSAFWYKKDDTVPSAVAAHRHAADRIMPIPASELVVAYPGDYGAPPPPLQRMIGQKVVFGVHLPRHVHASSYEDFRISKIWGLNMPRAQLLAKLPPPRLPQRTPNPRSRHETPILPDPAYVPPLPTYCEGSALRNPDPIESSSLPRTTRRKAQTQHASSDTPSDEDTLLSALRPRKRPPHAALPLATPPTPTITGTPNQPSLTPPLVHFTPFTTYTNLFH
ncbi:hypothetical protein LINGRAHAP2_LOCUS2001 [Linum grandiflorum]